MKNRKQYDVRYRKSRKGVISQNYACQLQSSRERGMDNPNYSNEDLQNWANSQDVFNIIYENWVSNEYKTEDRPSFDRIDDYKPYVLSNLIITTWRENKNKGHSDRKLGINNKGSKSISQYDLNDVFIEKYNSVRIAARKMGKNHGNISMAAKGKYKSAYGFIWKYE